MRDKMNRSLAMGDTVVVTSQFDWTPAEHNAGKITGLNVKNVYGNDGNVAVVFPDGTHAVYFQSHVIKIMGL